MKFSQSYFFKTFFTHSLFLFLIFFLFETYLSAQEETFDTKIEDSFSNYFGLKRESIYLHLNKSVYVKGEDIWFKAYLYNRVKWLPFEETTNLYVGIYDSIGNQLNKLLYKANKGYAKGQIEIDSTYSSGTYYVKATTNWMRNFKEDDGYTQKIEIYDQNTYGSSGVDSLSYDVQLLPEGGHLIANVQNNVGIKVMNSQGSGVQGLEGIIKNQNGVVVSRFKTGPFGLSKIEISPFYNTKYQAFVRFPDGKEKVFNFPKTERKGINIIVKHEVDNKLLIVLGTNEFTLKELGEKRFYLIIHRDGLVKKLEVEFPKNESYVSFLLDKTKLLPGMNILTLVDSEGKPLLERLVFNSNGVKSDDVEIAVKSIASDSLQLTFSTSGSKKAVTNFSVSILPENTLAYNHQDNIFSTFLLRPYVKGIIENPSHYFKNGFSRNNQTIDLLLLTQGWSKYSWRDIMGNPPKAPFEFEQGITLHGGLNSKSGNGDKLLMYSSENSKPIVLKVSRDDQKFMLRNFFPSRGEELKVMYLKNNQRLVKPNMYMSVVDRNFSDRIYDIENYDIGKIGNSVFSNTNLNGLELTDNTIQLNEVTVIENKIKKRFKTPQVFANRLTQVTPQIARSYPNFLDVIRSRGYWVFINPKPVAGSTDQVFISTRRPVSMDRVQRGEGQPPPLIYIDDVPIFNYDRLLYDYPTTKIESFLIDKSGNGEPGAGGGVIRIYTRDIGELDSAFRENTSKEKIYEYLINKGFEKEKTFYAPKYKSYGLAFENYGTIDWLPAVETNKKGEAAFKILKPNVSTISLFIEGMSTDGTLFSTVKTIDLNTSLK